MGNVNMEASQINYRGGEKKMSVEEALKNTSGEAAAIAQLQTDVLNLNSNKTDVYNGVSGQSQTFTESATYTVQTSGFYVIKVENTDTDSSSPAGFSINLGGNTESNRICDVSIDGTKRYQGIYAYLPLKAGAVIYANYSGATTTRCSLIVRRLIVN